MSKDMSQFLLQPSSLSSHKQYVVNMHIKLNKDVNKRKILNFEPPPPPPITNYEVRYM